ncbi:MAG TPA: M28 family peptidase [Blastocatellia bacterium]|nr:M28 family peptidase [Blastocatellia bacterium]
MRFSAHIMNKVIRSFAILIISGLSLSAHQAPNVLTDDVKAALARISADSLRGHLSFIASDALEGRNTPSRGLDIAAEYIAAQFRRAGLEPVGDDGYFQTVNWMVAERNMDDFELRIRDGKVMIIVSKNQVSLSFDGALNLARAAIIKIDYKDAAAISALKPEQVEGKIIITEIPDFRSAPRDQRMQLYQAQSGFMSKVSALKAALVISVDRLNAVGSGSGQGRLIDPENRRAMPESTGVPLITVHDQKVVNLYDSLKPGAAPIDATLKLAAPVEKPVKVRNVIGLLRGSDPVLKDTYVLVTAHYDHLGMRPGNSGDNIFNGANDDGSGTVSVIELASALATLKERPKRSLIFMTVFGEEKGLLGSRYYGRHPVFPIDKTVADVNLEQVGRTDSDEGPQLSNASMTGFDFSDVGLTFKAAGEMTDVKVYKHERNSDAFFGRSDNQALADQGVPAHTLCVAYVYPDYHGLGDHWDKIDYANMAKVNRCVALGLVMIANNPQEPKWNEANPKAARYLKAWKEHRSKAN